MFISVESNKIKPYNQDSDNKIVQTQKNTSNKTISNEISINHSKVHINDEETVITCNKKQKFSICNVFSPIFDHEFSKSLFLNEDEKKEFFENSPRMKHIIRDRKDKCDLAHYEYLKVKKEWCENDFQKVNEKQSKEIQAIRSKMRILIIIGSTISINQNKAHRTYFSGYEDFSLAFFLRDLFHFCYGLDYSQILITSTDEKDFKSGINASPKKFYKGPYQFLNQTPDFPSSSISQNTNKNMANFTNSNFQSFWRNKLISTQVGNEDLIYIYDYNIATVIQPFSKKSLELLNSNNDSELFVFFIDHGTPQGFSHGIYKNFLERFNHIKFNHATIINDACHSGFLVNIFKSCEIFDQLIHLPFYFIKDQKETKKAQEAPKAEEIKLEYTTIYNYIQEFSLDKQRKIQIILFNFFLQYPNWEKSKSNKKDESSEQEKGLIKDLPFYFVVILYQFQNLDEDVDDKVSEIFVNVINNEKFHQNEKIQNNFHNKMNEFINSFGEIESQITFIDPQLINSIGNKVTILSSCNYNEIALSLPLRSDIYFPVDLPVRACGTIYMSALIKCLFKPETFENDTIEEFIAKINKEFQTSKDEFYYDVKEQNTPRELTDKDNKNLKKVEAFIKSIPLFFNKTKDFKLIPFQKIILPNRIKFFDTKEVNPQEYENLKVKDYINISQRNSPISTELGPVDDKCLSEKLQEDFINCFNKNKESMNSKEIEDFKFEKCNDQFYEEALAYSFKVHSEVQKFITWQFQIAFQEQAPYIEAYLQRNINHLEEAANCIIETYRMILPYWDEIQFEHR